MSVSAQETVFHYVGNGVTVTFAFNCQVLLATDLNVYVDDALVSSGFGVSGIGSLTGGSVTFDAAPADQAAVRLERVVTLERTTDYQQNGDFLSRVVNPDFNRIWMALQQHLSTLNRAIKVPKSDSAAPPDLPSVANRANKLLSFDSLGQPIALAAAEQSATALEIALAAAGAGPGGFSHAVTYEPGTIGAKSRQTVCPTDAPFNAIVNGVNDNWAAIQAALDFVGDTGGGTVRLSKQPGKWRISKGLKIPSYVTLEGIAPDRYPFNSSPTASCLLLDFVDVNQWAIEPKTTKDGLPVPYNVMVKTTDVFERTYNCAVKNLRMEAVNTIPYGAVRMHGCPGSVVENVSAVGTGAGLLVNQCYGGSYVMHNLTKYYGTIAWEDVNACYFDVYNAGIEPATLVVPAGYLLPFMEAFNGSLVGTYKLNTNAHYNRSWGMIIGGSPSISANNRVNMVAERYSGGCFQHQAYGTVFEGFYVESAANVMSFGCVATVARFVINSLHAFMTGTGKVFDLGITVNARVTAIGLVEYPYFGYGPFLDASSLVTIDGVSPVDFGPVTPQFNLVYTSASRGFAAPAMTNAWVNFGAGWECGYRLNSRTGNVELRGRIKSGVVDSAAFTLPAGYRPSTASLFMGAGGQILITTAGLVIPTALSGTDVSLDGMSFYAEQ